VFVKIFSRVPKRSRLALAKSIHCAKYFHGRRWKRCIKESSTSGCFCKCALSKQANLWNWTQVYNRELYKLCRACGTRDSHRVESKLWVSDWVNDYCNYAVLASSCYSAKFPVILCVHIKINSRAIVTHNGYCLQVAYMHSIDPLYAYQAESDFWFSH